MFPARAGMNSQGNRVAGGVMSPDVRKAEAVVRQSVRLVAAGKPLPQERRFETTKALGTLLESMRPLLVARARRRDIADPENEAADALVRVFEIAGVQLGLVAGVKVPPGLRLLDISGPVARLSWVVFRDVLKSEKRPEVSVRPRQFHPIEDVSAADEEQIRIDVKAVSQQLPDQQWQMLVSRHVAEYRVEEVGSAHGVSVETVRRNLREGEARMRRAMAGYG